MRARDETSRRGFGRAFGTFTAVFLLVVAVAALLGQFGLPDRSIGFIVATVTLLAVVVAGLFGRTMRLSDFQLGGRSIPPLHNGMATAAACLGGVGFIGFAGALFLSGAGALAFGLGVTGGFVLLTVLVGAAFRTAGAATLPDFFALRFGGGLIRVVAPVVVLLSSFALLVAELSVGGGIAADLFGLQPDIGIALVVGLILLPALVGGMRSLAISGIAQYIVLVIAFLAPIVVYATVEFGFPIPQLVYGSVLHRIAEFPNAAADLVATPGRYFPSVDFGGFNFTLVLLTVAAGIAAMPHLVMRGAPVSNADSARRSNAYAFIFAMLVVVSAPAYAAFAKFAIFETAIGKPLDRLPAWVYALGEGGQASICGVAAGSADAVAAACGRQGVAGPLDPLNLSVASDAVVLAFPTIAGLSPLLTALLAVGALAAVLAAAASLLFAAGSALGHDLYPRLFDPHAPAGRRLIVIRLMLVAAALLAGWLAMRQKADAFLFAAASLSIAAAGNFPALVLGIWWKRCTGLGALCAMVSGAGVAIFYFVIVEVAGERPWSLFGLPGTAVPSVAAAAFGLPVGFFVAIAVSLATPRETAREALVDALRRPNGAPMPQDED